MSDNFRIELEKLSPGGGALKRLQTILDTPRTLLSCPQHQHQHLYRQSSLYSPAYPTTYASDYSSNGSSSYSSTSSSSSPVDDQQFSSFAPTPTPPPLSIDLHLKNLIVAIRQALKQHAGIEIAETRIGGGVASYIVANQGAAQWRLGKKSSSSNAAAAEFYNDIDFIFKINDDAELQENQLHSIRSIVIECFQTLSEVASGFVSKTVKVWNDRDRWTLISLGASPLNVDLIFVSKMARSYQFSVDSFQIVIDPLLQQQQQQQSPTSVLLYAESAFGDAVEALRHVRSKIVATQNAEMIRGGGLLRYCDLLAKGFKTSNGDRYDAKLEKIMCTRFFIDFPNVGHQSKEIERYLRNHFQVADRRKIALLRMLISVIHRSSQCIMNHERRMIMATIGSFINRESATLLLSHAPLGATLTSTEPIVNHQPLLAFCKSV